MRKKRKRKRGREGESERKAKDSFIETNVTPSSWQAKESAKRRE